MKTPLLITVDCGKTTCGKCEMVDLCNWCWTFQKVVKDKRCDACLRAEKGAGR